MDAFKSNIFAEKRTMPGGFLESAIRLNKYVVAQTTWGEAQVVQRAGLLADIAKKIWAFPSLSDEEIAPYIKA